LRDQTEPGRKIAAAVEVFRLTDGGDKRRRDNRAEAGDRCQSTGLFVLLRPADELGVEGRDPPIELSPLGASVGDEQSDPRLKPAPPCSSMRTIRKCSSSVSFMKIEFRPLFLKTLMLIAKLEDEFLELASMLRQVQQTSPGDFKKLAFIPQLGRRKAYYLVSIDKAFGDKNVPAGRLRKIGWTKLAALAPHITGQNLEDALLFAELNTVRNIEAVVHGLEPIVGGRSVLLIFTAEQFAAFSAAILAHGATKNGQGFIGKEAALIAGLTKNKE
jgi:hypothetical protein